MEIILEGVKKIVLQQKAPAQQEPSKYNFEATLKSKDFNEQQDLGAEETKDSDKKRDEEEEDDFAQAALDWVYQTALDSPLPPSEMQMQSNKKEETTGAGYYRGGVLGDVDEESIPPFETLLAEYNFYRLKLYQESLSSLKEKPIFSKADVILKTSKLQNYEGSASNVLREIMITTGSMTSNISKNRINLNQGISIDSKLVASIQKDNDVIMNRFIPVLIESDEIERYYREPFDKVLNNLSYINVFVGEL